MKIQVENLVYEYVSGKRVLNNVNLTIEGVQPTAIIGQNGAGKTTLVKHLNGIHKPTEGKILIDGVDITSKTTAQWAAHVGYVFQNPDDQLYLESVQKELEFGPKHIGMNQSTISSRVSEIAHLVGLSDKLDINPFDLSPTDKRFCAIASVLTMDTNIVIFDEPTCGQDLYGRERLRKVLAYLQERGKLCITISHDMRFVTELFPRVVVMRNGKVILYGKTEEVFSQEEQLKSAFIEPPPVARVARKVGLGCEIFSAESLAQKFMKEYGGKE